jgi:elongation factor P hydroxylase
MKQLPQLGRRRNLLTARLRVAILYLSLTISFVLAAETVPLYASTQVTIVPPFIGTQSETWERFGVNQIPSGTSILGGIATISGDHMVTARTFIMCSVVGRPSDGTILMDSDRPSGPLIISFSQPVSAFGAYWGSGLDCPFGDSPSILTFQDVNGNIVGSDSFTYTGNGTLMWRGYRFGTPVKTIIRTAGDGQEGIAMDGLQATRGVLGDFNGDGKTDYVLYNASTHQTVVWYMHNNVHVGGALGPTLPGGWSVVNVADFNRDGHPDYLLFNSTTRATAIWYMNNNVHVGGAPGPTLPGGWSLVTLADFNGDGYPDYLLFNTNTHATVVWYMHNNVHVGSAAGPTLPGGWNLVAAADFNGDGHPDYLLCRPSTRQSVIWYLSGITHIASAAGPTITAGYNLMGAADFDGNGTPDYVLYNPTTHGTALWYMNNHVRIGTASGPNIPSPWSLVAP